MRFFQKGAAGPLASWRLVFVILSLTVVRHSADPIEVVETPTPAEQPEVLPEAEVVPDEDSWGWSAGGWLSFGGWSSSWQSAMSGTRSMFRWRFGNVQPEVPEEASTTESVTEETAPVDRRPCEELTLEICRDLGYDATSMPNLLDHESQDIARVELAQYHPLVQVNCSSDMAFFLCSLHAPKCSEDGREGDRLLPCRPMCERIRSRCNVVMERFQFAWPSIFECEKYPYLSEASCAGQ